MKNNRKSSKVQFSLFDFLNVFQKENSGKVYTFEQSLLSSAIGFAEQISLV